MDSTTLNKQDALSNHLDWILFGLRWLIVIGGVLALLGSRGGQSDTSNIIVQNMLLVIAVTAIYNVVVAVLLLLKLNRRVLELVTLAADSIIAVLFFWASGSAFVLLGAGLLPVIVVGIRFGTLLSLALTAIVGVGGFAVAALGGQEQITTHGLPLLQSMVFLFLASSAVSLVVPDLRAFAEKSMSEQELEAKHLKETAERSRAIYELATTLGATLDYNKVLAAALEVGSLGLRESQQENPLSGMVMLFEKNELKVVSSRRLTRQDMQTRAYGRAGLIAQALKAAEPVFGSRVKDDPELQYFAAFQDAKSTLIIPLRAGFETYGVIIFGSHKPDAFSDEHIELLTAIGTQATIALQNAVLYENLQAEKERIVQVEEEARKKLARDLHDGPTQGLSAISMRVEVIRKMLDVKPQEVGDELIKVKDLANRTMQEMRHMLFTLRPLVLETQGLGAALEQLAQKMKDNFDLDVIVQSQAQAVALLENQAQGVLFYIVEEAVGNARKHAQANHIYVRLYRHESYVVVEVQDDGVGFDVESVTGSDYHKRGSLGMVNMRERAALVNGHLRLESAKGKGTKISILVPVREPATSGTR